MSICQYGTQYPIILGNEEFIFDMYVRKNDLNSSVSIYTADFKNATRNIGSHEIRYYTISCKYGDYIFMYKNSKNYYFKGTISGIRNYCEDFKGKYLIVNKGYTFDSEMPLNNTRLIDYPELLELLKDNNSPIMDDEYILKNYPVPILDNIYRKIRHIKNSKLIREIEDISICSVNNILMEIGSSFKAEHYIESYRKSLIRERNFAIRNSYSNLYPNFIDQELLKINVVPNVEIMMGLFRCRIVNMKSARSAI